MVLENEADAAAIPNAASPGAATNCTVTMEEDHPPPTPASVDQRSAVFNDKSALLLQTARLHAEVQRVQSLFNQTRVAIDQRAAAVLASPMEAAANDALAAASNAALAAATSGKDVMQTPEMILTTIPPLPSRSTSVCEAPDKRGKPPRTHALSHSSSSSSVRENTGNASCGPSNAHQANAKQPKQTKQPAPRMETRRELKAQLEGMQDLLSQLTLNNIPLQVQACRLALAIPVLRKVRLFGSGSNPNGQQAPQQQPQQQLKKQNQQPKIAAVQQQQQLNNSTAERPTVKLLNMRSLDEATSDVANDAVCSGSSNGAYNGTSRKEKRKRKARAKKDKIREKTQITELESLMQYINNIVADYLGEQQKERMAELEFKGGIDQLETHAQRLVAAGVGRIVEEEIRVNRKNNRQSFITLSNDRETGERDAIVLLPIARRYAFDGDVVRAFVLNARAAPEQIAPSGAEEAKKVPKERTIEGGKDHSISLDEDEDLSPTEADSDEEAIELEEAAALAAIAAPDNCHKAFVITIVQQTELRQIVGAITFAHATALNGVGAYYKLKPHDMRMPMVYVAQEGCTDHLTAEQKKDVGGYLYVAHVLETDVNGHCIGELLQPVGKVGNLAAEMKAILLHNGMKDIQPYEERFNELYAQPEPPIIGADHPHREDLRRKCIFTIDPLTARDLDDAMSVELLPSDNEDLVEVGVHISDVAHYLAEDSELDNIVKERSTSIYLVNEVIHMLPQPLCFRCSLLPGEDKFAFSVFWLMQRSDGRIVGQPRFTRTIIRSCSQLAYEHAQKIIDNPEEKFDADDFPTICNDFTVHDIIERVRLLHQIGQQLRAQRFADGALSINNPKMRFQLDPTSGEPQSYDVDDRQEANFLIEEFMLLANQSVARFIHDAFPERAILRNHAPPLAKSLKALRDKLFNMGITCFDHSSSKQLYESMQRICREASDPAAMDACLSNLLTKPMARAKYFCSEGKTEESELWHYALSIPIYTHFTSPIRRYPDILVHRLLAAALGYCPAPKRSAEELHYLTKLANDQKLNAKNAGDESIHLFFKRYVKAKQSLVMRAVVMEIFQHMANVVIIETGQVMAINYNLQKVVVDTSNAPAFILIAEKNSLEPPMKLQVFSTVMVKLAVKEEKLHGYFVSPDKKQRHANHYNDMKRFQEKRKQQQQQQQQYGAQGRRDRASSQSDGNGNASGSGSGNGNGNAKQKGATPKNNKDKSNRNESHQRVFALREDSAQ